MIDSEVTQVLRGLAHRGGLNEQQGGLALEDFSKLTITRFPADWLRPRMWALRHNLSGYDATALLTTSARLAEAPGPRCHIQLL